MKIIIGSLWYPVLRDSGAYANPDDRHAFRASILLIKFLFSPSGMKKKSIPFREKLKFWKIVLGKLSSDSSKLLQTVYFIFEISYTSLIWK